MGVVPSQWISWDHTYVNEPGDELSEGSSSTRSRTRCRVAGSSYWKGSARGLIGYVDFAGHNRKAASIYYAWGAITYLQDPVGNDAMYADPVLRAAFSNRQGRAKHLAREVALHVEALAGGFPAQWFPSRDPKHKDELDIWVGAMGESPSS